ncbi:CAP domain-containing protein [Chengkuizengella axinellae]|uniref:CAP domain-containing protein n=1 Tax=Chengkuizengella axinellae TaxID=3064388 RepID=A0ABT9IWU3_9BACL|nr:CAP domain-containing protein [Chengkuizengella sp. 2205SS18-9]MDP5273255.1 CAP domain-containing protein [Chengkuizengella sp. 2205SS18-9]
MYPGQLLIVSNDGNQYTVKANDTMWIISQKLGVGMDSLIAANPQIANPNSLTAGQVINVPQAGSTAAVTNASPSGVLSSYEQQVVDLTNAERAKYGLPALKVDDKLSEVARLKSVDMQSRNYFSHTSPSYGSPFDMMRSFGVSYSSAAENIAYGQKTPQEVVNAWMNSSGHRKNILSTSYTHIGVGYVEQGNFWTQMFIGK